MNILCCDDDPIVKEALRVYMKEEGYATTFASDGEEALLAFRSTNPDFIVLDIMMPKKNGLEVCKEIRKESDVPILLLTAKGEEIDRILGFELGADDYIVKPFSAREVIARIKAIQRRLSESREKKTVQKITYKNLEVNQQNYTIRVNQEAIPATPKEVEILFLLMSHPSQVFTRDQILNLVWGYSYYGDTRSVDTHIKRIRAKLPPHLHDAIQTIYGVGYKFEEI
ncbi:MAG: DNA-binding response regulator [Firmicutes bacterium GWF2_51_9]|nr:MAG: DNA-binding response regulator [Firmicutes bacterium GWF2_51_9]OGS57869.1 MAG: DNA-binding response regulator [Firmicutes bacterium GWE2_51_13]HAM63903.1 DNA-binding response regulator [Erysipelotrichaceae bacterium]HBZ41350.1 DNA-binding response regulator [Erysipelotrichaceae bacterium]